jgi:hypothetical protein
MFHKKRGINWQMADYQLLEKESAYGVAVTPLHQNKKKLRKSNTYPRSSHRSSFCPEGQFFYLRVPGT